MFKGGRDLCEVAAGADSMLDRGEGERRVTMEKIVGLCKRRGFVFPSSEIYGGQGGVWDYGPMGIALKNNKIGRAHV